MRQGDAGEPAVVEPGFRGSGGVNAAEQPALIEYETMGGRAATFIAVGRRGASWRPDYGPGAGPDKRLSGGSRRSVPCTDEVAARPPGVAECGFDWAGRRQEAVAVVAQGPAAAAAAPVTAEVSHPEFGTLTTVDVIRRNAHEVHHHLMDISRAGQDPPPGS